MKKFIELIEGAETSDARSAFYYLGRYLKQAEHYWRYEKDFFEDDYQSKPSEEAKALTFSLIDFIEEYENKKANDFTDEQYIFWVEKLDEVESKLDPEPTKEQIEVARAFIADEYDDDIPF
ncbi:hypothetical protein [Shewanella sp. S1-58-MNA-CIBAN-0166]|uniref:hypothetical protein n=1 Tax=Shewanella sp. S1-58-MNA-CIBAN-0166 TaxID=3140467 RepID=UPI00331A7A63